jgi:hypothetical protein
MVGHACTKANPEKRPIPGLPKPRKPKGGDTDALKNND